MVLVKTEKGRAELRPGVRTLGQRERTVLLLADGTRSLGDLDGLFAGEGREIALRLIQQGLLGESATASEAVAPAPLEPPQPQQQPADIAADTFEGKRSLATTRMFLFDLCERLFVRRDPALAETFRETLRNAKDRASMLAASRLMIEEVERIAGHERADSLSERIAMLLPPEEVQA